MWRALLSRLAVASSAVVAVLVACEIALRVYVSPAEDTGKTVAAEPAKLMRQEPRTGWVPNEGARVEKRDASGSPYVVRINSTGQRGPEVPRRRLGERRLLFLGDSYTMADQVSERETFVDLTGNLLGEAIGRPVVSVNGGVNGYGTYQEMAYYRYYGRPVDADVVVLVFFPGNDYRDNMTHTLNGSSLNPVYLDKPERYARHGEDLLRDAGKRAILDPFSGDAIPRPESAWVESLQRRSLLGRLLGSRFAKLEGRLTGNLFLLDLSSRYYFYEIGYYQTRDDGYFATARELTIECLDLLRQWVRWDGAELVVVLLPSPYQVGVQQLWQKMLVELRVDEEDLGPLDFTYPNRLIASLCRERGVPYLDLTAAFARADNSANLYLTAVGDGHMSAAGHALLARELTGFLHAEIAPLQNPDIDTYWRLKGQLRAGRLTAAGELLKQSPVAQTWPAFETIRGDYHARLKDWQAAAAAYVRAVELDGAALHAVEGLARARAAIGDTAAAVASWRRAQQLQPTWWAYQLELAALLGRENPEAKAAQRRVDRLFEAPRQIRGNWWAEHISRGVLMMERGRIGDAERAFGRAMRFIPDDPVAYYTLGWVLQRTGRGEAAREQYERSLGFAPEFDLARKRLAELR